MKIFLLVLATLALAGCASAPAVSSLPATDLAARATITHDDFRKYSRLELPAIEFGFMSGYYLAAVKNDGEATVEPFLYFATNRFSHEGWAFWENAWSADGKRLAVDKLRRDVLKDGGTYEAISINYTRDNLAAAAGAGLRLRIDGQNAQQEIFIPPNYISAFLAKLDEFAAQK